MAGKPVDIRKLLIDNLGKEAAAKVLVKMEKMVAAGKTPAAIEKMITADLHAHVEQQVATSVIAKIGPITPIKLKPITVSVKPAIKPITVSPKINTGISVKVGPGPMLAKGSK